MKLRVAGVWAGRWCWCWTTSVPVHFPVVVHFVVLANGSSSRSATRRSVCFPAWCVTDRSGVRRQSSLAPCWGDVGGWPFRRQKTRPRRQHRWSCASRSHLRCASSGSVAGSYTISPDEIRLILEWVSHPRVLLSDSVWVVRIGCWCGRAGRSVGSSSQRMGPFRASVVPLP